MSTFIKTTTCQKITQKCCSGNLFGPQEDKDVLISKLTTKINKLEQQEKDFDILNQEFKQLENDYTLLNEAKLRLEYEIKQREEAYNKRICDLKSANENLQNGLNDKMCVNKKLFEEKQCLENTLKSKNDEIADTKDKINNLNDKLNSTQNNKDDLQNNLRGLNDLKLKQRDQITDLVNDNKRLAKLCQEQDHSLYLADQEKQKLSKKIMDDNANISNLNSKLRAHGNNLNNLQKQLDNSNEINIKLKDNVKNLENELTNDKIDNENLNNELCRERGAREDEEKKNDQLKCILCDRENKIKYLNNDYEKIKIAHQKKSEERSVYQNENEKLKEHIMILTRQNQDLTQEIDNVIREDEQIQNVLERMSLALKDNDDILSQLPEEILCCANSEVNNNFCCSYKESNKLFLSQNNEIREISHSPKCTYTFESQS